MVARSCFASAAHVALSRFANAVLYSAKAALKFRATTSRPTSTRSKRKLGTSPSCEAPSSSSVQTCWKVLAAGEERRVVESMATAPEAAAAARNLVWPLGAVAPRSISPMAASPSAPPPLTPYLT